MWIGTWILMPLVAKSRYSSTTTRKPANKASSAAGCPQWKDYEGVWRE